MLSYWRKPSTHSHLPVSWMSPVFTRTLEKWGSGRRMFDKDKGAGVNSAAVGMASGPEGLQGQGARRPGK